MVEGDGTGLKLFKHEGENCHVQLWGLAERPRGSAVPRTVVYFVPVKKVAPNAVCPVARGVKQHRPAVLALVHPPDSPKREAPPLTRPRPPPHTPAALNG